MSGFDEVRLPDDIERGARGGPAFNTSIAQLQSGFERRNINWTRERSRWNVGYGVQSKVGYTRILEFFKVRRGRGYGFRFKDWSDYQITEQSIGTGDASRVAFQIYKRYTSGPRSYDRPITKIVAGSYTVKVNAVTQTETTHFTLNANTGVITFVTPPGSGLPVTISCEFDVPVRFDTDELDLQVDLIEAGQVPNIPIVELLTEAAL